MRKPYGPNLLDDMRLVSGVDGAGHTLKTDTSGRLEISFVSGAGVYKRMGLMTLSGAATTGAQPLRLPNETGVILIIEKVAVMVNTAPAGADLIVDVNKNGTTIFTTQSHRPVIADGANTGETLLIDVTAWADGEYLTFDVDQCGSDTPGADLTVCVVVSRW